MADSTSGLVFVGPDDSVETILKKVRGAGASTVQLLVSEGAAALQGMGALAKLKQSADDSSIKLLLITSDEKTLSAAKLCQVETLGVTGVQVQPHRPSDSPKKRRAGARSYETLPLPEAAAGLSNDDEFLQSLESLSPPSLPSRIDRAASALPAATAQDSELFGALDDLSSGLPRSPVRPLPRADDEYAAALDEWGDLSAASATPENQANYGDPEPRTPRDQERTRRFRPDEIELSDEDRRRAASADRRAASRASAAATAREAAAARSGTRYDDEPEDLPARRRSNPLVAAIPVIVVLLLIAIVGAWLFNNQATVIITLPQPVTEEQVFNNQVIATSREATAADSAAVQVVPVQATAAFTATGSVTTETEVPGDSAKGEVTLFNQNTAPVNLPQGTEFIGTNPGGQEVRFTSDVDVSVGGATTARQGAQIITNLGQAQVPITARAPGSSSNIEANTITQFAVSGQPVPLSGVLSIEHGAIGGGNEQKIRIVTENDVQQLLATALTGLDEAGRGALQAQASGIDPALNLEITTITPTRELLALGQNQIYEMIVTPPVGQPVDMANPSFSLLVRASFDALATPSGRPLTEQLAVAVPRQLANESKMPAGMAPTVSNWRWDGSRLLVDGTLTPSGEGPRLDVRTRREVTDALLGKTREEAINVLEGYKQQGVIGSYTLPDRDSLPGLNFQLKLEVKQ